MKALIIFWGLVAILVVGFIGGTICQNERVIYFFMGALTLFASVIIFSLLAKW